MRKEIKKHVNNPKHQNYSPAAKENEDMAQKRLHHFLTYALDDGRAQRP